MKSIIQYIQHWAIMLCLIVSFSSVLSQGEISYRGSMVECLDPASGHMLTLINHSDQVIFGFRMSVEREDGSPATFGLQSIVVSGDSINFDVDDNLDGNLGGPGENDDNDASPGTVSGTLHAPAPNTHPIRPGDTVIVNLSLTANPGTRWCLGIQATNAIGAAIAVPRSELTGLPPQGCLEFGLEMSPEMSFTANFPGMSLIDINATGGIMNNIFLVGFNAQVTNAVQLDQNGNPLPLSLFNNITGELQLAQPVLPGEPVYIMAQPNFWVGGEPMLITGCSVPPQPSSFPQARILNYEQYAFTGNPGPDLANILGITMRYEIPLTSTDKYLQVLYRPRWPGSSGLMYWGIQNMVLETFDDSMDLTVFLDLDPEGMNADSVRLAELVDMYTIISDTIMEQGPVLGGPFETVFPSPFIYDFTDGIGGLGTFPNVTIPQLPGPPRVWTNSTSTGVLIGCKMPNIDLDSSRYKPGANGPHVPGDYAGDWNACAPAGPANSFSWLRGVHPDIENKLNAAFGQGDSAHRKMLAEFSKLMKRANEGGAGKKAIVEAKLAFVDKYKLPVKVSYQSILPEGNIASPNPKYGHTAADSSNNPGGGKLAAGGVDLGFMLRKMQDTCDVELGLIWLKPNGGKITATGGHMVTLTGIRKSGDNWTIKFKDDEKQGEAGGTRQPSVGVKTSGAGLVYIPELSSNAKGVCIIRDVFVECHDKSVTFKAVKGKAFRDLNKDGSGGGSGGGLKGFEGLGLELLDPTGNVVGTTTTDADGNFWFSDLPNDTSFRIRVPVLPPGWDFSTPNAVNDSIDSDIDPTTGESPLVSFMTTDTSFTMDVGLTPPGNFPLTQDINVCQVSFTHPIVLPQSNTASLGYTYYLPPGDPLHYLNILYQPAGTTDTLWLADNFTLEQFDDTMTLSFFFDIDSNATASSTTLPVTEGRFKVFTTDTIIPIAPTVANWDTIPFGLCGYAVANNDIEPPIDFSGLSGITINPPRLPPRSWQTNDTTKGVLIGCKMPNIDLNSDAYNTLFGNGPHVPADYAGDLNACGPAATANSFHWLAGFNPAIGDKLKAAFGEGDSAHRKMMAEMSALMQREDEGMTSIENLIKGKLAFIDKYKLPMKVTYQSMHMDSASLNSPNDCYGHKATRQNKAPAPGKPFDKVDPEWIHDRLKDTCDVEMLVAWLVWDPVNMEWTTSRGGHFVTVTGIRQNKGNWRIKWKEDTLQTDEGGLFQGISDIQTDARGFLRIPGLDQRDASGTGIAVIANVVAECYDPTVTHTSTKGSASEDSDGDGLQDSGEASIQGQEIWIIDNATGLVVGMTTTGADGSFVLGDLQPGDYYLELPSLLPGFGLALPNQGPIDSLDFDFDQVTLRSPVFNLVEDSVLKHIDLGMIADSVVRLRLQALLEGPYDPSGDSMFVKLWDQDLLPDSIPQIFLGHTFDTTYFGFPMPPLPDSLLPVNLCVVQLRDSADSTLAICTRPAMLFQTGELWYIDPILGFTQDGIRGIDGGSYYPVLLPPGHLPIMPNQPLLLPPSLPGLELQLQSVLMTPFGPDDRVTVGTNKRALRAGDTNGDGAINADDRAGTWNERNTTGYKQKDVNFDGAVNADDRAATWNNRNKVGTVPK